MTWITAVFLLIIGYALCEFTYRVYLRLMRIGLPVCRCSIYSPNWSRVFTSTIAATGERISYVKCNVHGGSVRHYHLDRMQFFTLGEERKFRKPKPEVPRDSSNLVAVSNSVL